MSTAANGNGNGNGRNGDILKLQNGEQYHGLPATKIEPAKGPEEDEEIFSFFKKYVGLLTLVGSLPVITAGIDVIAPPGGSSKLSAISSFTCIIALGVCVLFKKSFASWSVSRSAVKRAIAPSIALILLIAGITLTGLNSQHKPAQAAAVAGAAAPGGVGGEKQAVGNAEVADYLIYLFIFPCFVGALGVTLMASYSQFHGARLEAKIDQKIMDPATNKRLKDTIESYISVLTASADSRIESFSNSFLKEFDGSLGKLSTGYVEAFGTKIEEMQKQLLEHFHQTVYAVSDRDLKFWLNGFCDHIKSSDDLIAKQYLRLNIDAVSKGTKVTRIFIFQDSDFNHNKADIVAVLAKHQEAGIGWAVLIHEELPTHLKGAQQSFDFALMDGQTAVAVLSNYNMDSQRRLYVLLDVPGSLNAKIVEYAGLHKELVSQCWLASDAFCDIHGVQCKSTLEEALEENRDKSHALNFGSGKVIHIDKENQIADAIEFIRGLRRKNMLYWGEVQSSNVIDLAGDWTYTVKGVEPDGVLFEHSGYCQGVIEAGTAYFAGVRTLTSRQEPGAQPRQAVVSAPWKSSPIQFNDDGRMEYSSTISIDGEDFRGLGEIRFVADRKRLKGEIHMITERNKVVSADVDFHRRVEHPKHNTDAKMPAAALARNKGDTEMTTSGLRSEEKIGMNVGTAKELSA